MCASTASVIGSALDAHVRQARELGWAQPQPQPRLAPATGHALQQQETRPPLEARCSSAFFGLSSLARLMVCSPVLGVMWVTGRLPLLLRSDQGATVTCAASHDWRQWQMLTNALGAQHTHAGTSVVSCPFRAGQEVHRLRGASWEAFCFWPQRCRPQVHAWTCCKQLREDLRGTPHVQVEGMWPYWLDGFASSTVRNSFALNSMFLLTGACPCLLPWAP